MFFEIKNPYVNDSSARPYLYFGTAEEVMLSSVDDIMKTCILNDIEMEGNETIIVSKRTKGKSHQKPRRKDNSRKAKELAKERKANRVKAKERRGIQRWLLYSSDRDTDRDALKDLFPVDPWKLKTRKEKRLEALAKEMLQDDDNPTWEQVNNLLEEEAKAKQFIAEQNDLLVKMRKERSELLTKLSRLELEIDKKEEMVSCYGNRFKP